MIGGDVQQVGMATRPVMNMRVATLSLIGLLLCFGLPELKLGALIASGDGLTERLVREGIWWAFGAIILIWVVAVERLPLASIGLKRPTGKTLLWGVLAMIVMMASVMLCYAILFPAFGLKMNMAATKSLIAVPLWLQTATMLRAGVVEEILYRGYPIERLERLTGSTWLAALVPAMVFIATHFAAWGGAQLIVVTFGAALLTLLYVWRRDLVACMIAHFLTDFIGFMLARLQS